ncbi:MAG: prepilin-type N-terminal cleavage/methylation protein, partial [Verrucomicrobiaceae bacterium]|nr:prepilin-type N-terminal cleavage/methylation protein [Verrucomicrobiaceae bacterium]
RKTEVGWLLVDGYGHPFQYTKGGEDSVNTTYDLWSFGESPPVGKISREVKQAAAGEGKWIANW